MHVGKTLTDSQILGSELRLGTLAAGLRPDPCWGNYSAPQSPDPLAVISGRGMRVRDRKGWKIDRDGK